MDLEAIKNALVVMGKAMLEMREIMEKQLKVQEEILEELKNN